MLDIGSAFIRIAAEEEKKIYGEKRGEKGKAIFSKKQKNYKDKICLKKFFPLV
jgi:hypothetical protein